MTQPKCPANSFAGILRYVRQKRILLSHSWRARGVLAPLLITALAVPLPSHADSERPGRHLSDAGREPFDIVTQGVDTRTRDYAYSHTDISLPGALGPRVALTRTFRVNDPSEGPFGTGWRWRFTSGASKADALTDVTDRHGNRVTYQYTPNASGAKRLLTAIITFHLDKQRGYALVKDYSLAIQWNIGDPAHPRVASATSYQENPRRILLQTVTYGYADGPAHSVTSERSPGGKITRYAYHRWTSPAYAGAPPSHEDDLLSAISAADGATTRIAYNDEWGGDYAPLTQTEAMRVQAARVTSPTGRITEFVPAGTENGASGTHLMMRHTELMPGGAEGYSVRSVYYVPGDAGIWVVSGWHSQGVERLYDRAGRLIQEDSRAGFRWSRRVPARLIAPPRADMDYDDRRHFWTLVDMMHAVFWQDVFSPGVPGTQLLDGGIVTLRKRYSYDDLGRRTVSTVQGFPFTPFESLPETSAPLTYTRRTAYWGAEKYGQKKIEIDPAGRRVFYDYYDSHAAPELRGNLRVVYADVSAGVKNGRAIAYNPYDRPIQTSGQAALGAHPRPGAVPVTEIAEFDPLGQPRTIRTLQSLSPARFTVERRAPATAPLGLSTESTATEQRGAQKTATTYDALGRIVRKTVTRAGHIVAKTRTAYAHDSADLLASDGEVARRQRQTAGNKPGVQEFQYTPGGLLRSVSDHDGDGPVIRRSVQYEARDGAATGRPLVLNETWNGAPRFRMTYTYGGFNDEDLIRKTLTVLGAHNETWSWDYGRTFTAADLAMRRIPARIVQTAPPSARLPLQAIDYLYDSCLGALGLVRFSVVDSNPAELATEWLQDQHPSQFQFVWYARDSFGRAYDTRTYLAQYGQTPRPTAYTYTLTSRTERFRLKPDPSNLSGYAPTSFTAATAPYDPAGHIPYQRTIQFAPAGKTARTIQQEVRGYDLSDRLATSKSYGSVGDWTRAAHTDFEEYDGLTQPLWAPGSVFMSDAPISRRVRRAGGGYTDIFYDDGQPLMEREYDRKGKLARVRTRIIGARGVEAVTESNPQRQSQILWIGK